MKKLCFVCQRYGLEVNGGAELQCRLFAEHMVEAGYEVNVFTSKAIDYSTWKNEYTEAEEVINGVQVYRFSSVRERGLKFRLWNKKLFHLGLSKGEERKWFEAQGPFCPELTDCIEKRADEFDAFVFFTYLYYPTVYGLPKVADKSILVPEAHDEPFLKLQAIKNLFESASAIFFNTEEERDLVYSRFNVKGIPSDIGGIGIETPEDIDSQRFKSKYGLEDYILYIGRLDNSKNCDELFSDFLRYKNKAQNNLKLVLMGKGEVHIPGSEDIVNLGFVSEEDKYDGLSGAKCLVMPSRFESLSMVVLEAMSVKTLVIVNGYCKVLKAHCEKSKGALYYEDYAGFEKCLDFMLSNNEETEKMKENALRYVNENYRWETVTERLAGLIDRIGEQQEVRN